MRQTARALTMTIAAAAVGTLVAAGGAGGAAAKPGGVPAIPLNAAQETSDVASDGSGFFSYTVDGATLCYTLEVRDMTAAPIAAHIHLGARNVAGGIVVGLTTPPAATSTVSACITATEGGNLTPAELAAIVADPGSYYVNVHTPLYPAGEIRGQLK